MSVARQIPVEENAGLDLLNDFATLIASGELRDVLSEAVHFISGTAKCDSCFLYVAEGDELVLRASKNAHPKAAGRLKLKSVEGVADLAEQYCLPVAIERGAFRDPRCLPFKVLPDEQFESFLSVPLISRGRFIGVINLRNRDAHVYGKHELRLISTMGVLLGAEVELVRLASENSQLSKQLKSRKLVERAKGILQQELKISEQVAYTMLQQQSQGRRKPMSEIADAIVLASLVKNG
jgi:uroporphyrinogen-III synthase